MTKQIDRVIKKLPIDFSKHCTRDISLLSCSIFGETYAKTLKEKFGSKFSATLWVIKDNQINFYRSEKEHNNFMQKSGELCKNPKYAQNLATKLIQMTDWFNLFLKQNKNLANLVKNNKIFFDNYREFFAYHQAVNWAGNYLSELDPKIKETKKIKLQIKKLHDAYKYNELVVPNLEKYFRKLKINNLLHDEIDKNVKNNIKTKLKNRGLLFIKNKRIIFSQKEAEQLEDLIKKKKEISYKKVKKIKGTSASSGIFTGKVRVILNLNQLKNCQPNEVLVTTMTRPQFNKYIRQVGAIVTDEGGMLCHAAILSREFGIPCIIGTKIATTVLRNGDPVRVDANKGEVCRLR